MTKDTSCHLDPDLIAEVFPRKDGWRSVFGQIDRAQSHLKNQEIKERDFYYGGVRKTIMVDGKLKFDPNWKADYVETKIHCT